MCYFNILTSHGVYFEQVTGFVKDDKNVSIFY